MLFVFGMVRKWEWTMGVQPVLVVADEADIRPLARDVLIEEGFTVVIAVDGREALQRVVEHNPAVILLDIHIRTYAVEQSGRKRVESSA